MIPLRKTAEMFMAVYVIGFSGFVAASHARGVNALEWTGMTHLEALQFAWFCLGASAVHAFGIRLNGSFRWSPFIRAAALIALSLAFLDLAWAGAGNTASYTYLWVFFGFFLALRTTVRDCILAWRGHYGTTH